MKINFDDKRLKDFFEARDKEFLRKIYEDAVSTVITKNKLEISQSAKNWLLVNFRPNGILI